MEFNSEKIREIIFIEKNYEKALDELFSTIGDYEEKKSLTALAYYFLEDYKKAAKIYSEIDEKYQEGYCHFLLGDIQKAKKLWENTEPSPASEWGLCLINLINSLFFKEPSFMEIRSFLERDIEALLKAKQDNLVRKIASKSHLLYRVNPESYKFFGKAFLNHGKIKAAREFFEKSYNYTDKDPELYYLIAKCDIAENKVEKGIELLKKAINMHSNYVPAKKLLEKIQNLS